MSVEKDLQANSIPQDETGADENLATRGLEADVLSSANVEGADNLRKKDALILVVDDSVESASLISFHLQEQGYRVITASNGEDGIKVASLMRPKIVLMDIAMPIMDGLAATTKIREDIALRDVPVIAITAFSTGGFQRAASNVGFDGYLTKPIDFERLHELIATLLSKSDAGHPEARSAEEEVEERREEEVNEG